MFFFFIPINIPIMQIFGSRVLYIYLCIKHSVWPQKICKGPRAHIVFYVTQSFPEALECRKHAIRITIRARVVRYSPVGNTTESFGSVSFARCVLLYETNIFRLSSFIRYDVCSLSAREYMHFRFFFSFPVLFFVVWLRFIGWVFIYRYRQCTCAYTSTYMSCDKHFCKDAYVTFGTCISASLISITKRTKRLYRCCRSTTTQS